MVKYNLVQALFWRLHPPVRQLVWCSLLSVNMTPAASHTPTPPQAQRAEVQASSGGTCCKFFLPTRRPHEGSHDSGDSLDTTILRNMGQGRRRLGAQTFSRCVGKAPGSQWVESSSETLLTSQEIVWNCSAGFTSCYWGLCSEVVVIFSVHQNY